MDENEPFRFCVEEKEKGKSFGGGKQNLLHLPKIIFCWVGFDKVMPREEETNADKFDI